MNQSKQIHEICTEHSKLEQEVLDMKDEVKSFRKRLDWIAWLLVIVCIESGITIPLMG